MSPSDTAIFWIEYIHRHGKDVLKPPILELTWWQASLLDVYGFILASVIISLYVLFRITIVICKLLSLMLLTKKIKTN